MILLDENIPENQRQLLRSWRIHARQIGLDVSHKGIQDDAIIPFLLQRSWPTFFSRDLDFYSRRLCHRKYCLVCLAVHRQETASFIQRFLKHPTFDTRAKRLGTVSRVSSAGIHLWQLKVAQEAFLPWSER